MEGRSRWYALRERFGHRLQALGKSIAADTATVLPPGLVALRKAGELPALPPQDLYAGLGAEYDKVRQELAPLNFNPFGFENPQRVVAAIVAHLSGQFQQSGLLSQALLTDPKIAGPLSIRANALVGLPVKFHPVNDSSDAKDLADLCREHYRSWFRPAERTKFVRDRLVMGFTRAQLIFTLAARQPGGGWFRHPDVNTWMPGQYVWWYWDPARNFGRWLQSDKDGTVEPVPGDGQWVFSTLTSKQPWIEGLIMSLGLRYAMRLSVALNMTRFASALASGHNVYSGPVQLDGKSFAFIQAQFADPNNLNLLLPSGTGDNGWDVKWVGPNSAGAKDLFLGALEESGMECAEVILGQNLTTEVKKGSFAAIKGAAQVRQDVLEFDAIVDQTDAREQILKPAAALNFGDADLAPMMEIVAEPTTDRFLWAKALHDLVPFLQAAPPSVDVDELLQRYDVPLKRDFADHVADDAALASPAKIRLIKD